MFQKIRPYISHILVLALLVGAGVALFNRKIGQDQVKPKNVGEYAATSAMISLTDKSSGGSGVVLRSSDQESLILTNKHVCEVIQGGGSVTTLGKDYRVAAYKVYPKHDLCLVKVLSNLKVTTVVANTPATMYSHAYVSGHPALLPHVVSEGYFSDRKTIEILVDIKECNEEELLNNTMACLFMGGTPIFKKFKAQFVTAHIMPGSSGSAVFNEQGEIAGLIFAGSSQGLSYGFMVPLEAIQDFIKNENQYKWRKPVAGANAKFLAMIEKSIKIACTSNKLYSSYCSDNGQE